MVEEKHCPLRVGYIFESAFLELAQRQRAGAVLNEGEVNLGDHYIASTGIGARSLAQYFLGDGFAQSEPLLK
jgi:hypothetical protein